MKPYAKLNRADLVEFPIWEWLPDDAASDIDGSTDESFIQPTHLSKIPSNGFGQYIAAATISLRNGERLPGIVEVTTANDSISIQATTVFLLDRQLQIPGMETNRLLTRYTKILENYPVGWELNVRIGEESESRTGAIKHGDLKEIVAMGVEALMTLKGLRKK